MVFGKHLYKDANFLIGTGHCLKIHFYEKNCRNPFIGCISIICTG
jgi:hypothetical protein